MGDPHDRLKVVCAFDSDLARARGTVLRPPSAVSSFGGFRTPAAEYAAPSLKRPASETLLKSGSYPPAKPCPLIPQNQTFQIQHYANNQWHPFRAGRRVCRSKNARFAVDID